jgi:PAS domain S-box-containing protein
VVHAFFGDGARGSARLGRLFLTAPPMIWVALRFGVPGVARAQFLVAVIAIAATTTVLRPLEPHVLLFDVQLYLTVTSGTYLLLGAVNDERRRVLERHEETGIALRQSNRALRLLTMCNTAIVRATDEQGLLEDICRIAVENAGYRMAWIGRAEHDEARTVAPVTFAGSGAGFLEHARVTWADDVYGHGAAGTAIRTRRPAVERDLPNNPKFAVWRELLRQYEYRSAIAVPLELADEVYGILLIYASEPSAFESTEVTLLDELGGNVSHGILALRTQRALAAMTTELRVARDALEERVVMRTRELEESRERYRELVENANSIILRIDSSGRITFANEFAISFFGYSEDELLGHSITSTIVPPTERSGRDLSRLMRELIEHPGKFATREYENVRRSGERVWIAWANRPILDTDGRLSGVLCVGNDITCLKRAEAELVKAKEAAEAADRIKSAFLATMSHELRTPLNSIVGFTGILLQGLAGPLNDEQKKQLGMVQTSSRHLLALINDVLDISKIEAGQLTILHEPFDVRPLLEQVVETLRPLALKKGLELRTECACNLGLVVGDRRRFEQVLTNLVGNAVKFTEHGSVTLRCAACNGSLSVSVQDTGIGIPREQFPNLFRPFSQLDSGTTRKHEGTGLGLSISKRLAEMMGGSIGVDSTLGEGSRFTVELPLQAGRA